MQQNNEVQNLEQEETLTPETADFENEKKKRIFVASVATGVVLLVLLLLIMCYQIIGVCSKKRELNKLNTKIEKLTKEKEETEDEIAVWLTKWKLEREARKLGYYYPGEKIGTEDGK